MADPDLQIRKGGGAGLQKLFSALRALVWSKDEVGGWEPSPRSATTEGCNERMNKTTELPQGYPSTRSVSDCLLYALESCLVNFELPLKLFIYSDVLRELRSSWKLGGFFVSSNRNWYYCGHPDGSNRKFEGVEKGILIRKFTETVCLHTEIFRGSFFFSQ